MRSRAISVVMVVAVAVPAAAGEDDGLQGSVEVGYRTVDVNGNEDKYREDVNLDDEAVRLLGLQIDFRPADSTWFDTLLIDANGLGGEPHESGRFRLRKTNAYDLDLRYRSADRFYRDAGYFFRDGGDLHTWDTNREFHDVRFKVRASDWLTLRVGADRAERDGGSTTSRNLQRDVFVLDRPVDQQASSYWLAADFKWGWADITVEERLRSHENRWALATSGNDGVEAGEPASLIDYRQERLEEADAPITRLSLRGRPGRHFRFVVDYARMDADLDFDTQGAWEGVDFTGASFQTTLTNSGTVDRTSDLFDLDLSFLVHPALDVVVDYSHRAFDQNGSIDSTEQQTGGAEAGTYVVRGDLSNELQLDTVGVALDWRPSRSVSLLAGAGFQERTKDFQLSGPEVTTERTVYRAGIRWRPGEMWDLRLDYEQGDDDDPLTQISPTSTDRVRFRARIRPVEGLTFAFNALDESRENDLVYPLGKITDDVPAADDIFLARFDVTTASLAVTWSKSALDLSAGFATGRIDSDAHIVYVTGSTFVPAFDFFTTRDRTAYESNYDVIDAAVRYAIGAAWSVGAEMVLTDNSGGFPVKSDYYRGFARYAHGSGVFVKLAFERYDYDETNPFAGDPSSPTPDVNDYDADLWTASLGYRF